MPSPASTKTCPICYSEIDARSLKCAQCHSLQGFSGLAQRGAIRIAGWLIVSVPVVIIGLIGLLFYQEHFGHARLKNDAENIEIVKSQQYFAPSDSGTTAKIVGIVRNKGKKALEYLQLEVRFFNSDHELIDLIEGTVPGPIEPSQERPFKVDMYDNIHLPESDYASHEIVVTDAYESRRRLTD